LQAEAPALPIDECESPGQAVHAALPSLSLKVPPVHAVQGPPIGPVYPTPHSPLELGGDVRLTHSETRLLASSEKESAGQLVHEALPTVSLNLPEEHASHAAPFAPVYPGLQTQSKTDTLAKGENVLAGQALHAVLPFSDL